MERKVATRAARPALEPASCARCGASSQRERFRVRAWRIVDCLLCGLRYVSPRQPAAAYAALYDAAYFESPDSLVRGYDDYAGERDAILQTFRRRFAQIRPLLPAGAADAPYLDIGCAFGYALECAAELGLRPHGVDVSAHAVTRARAAGLDVVLGGTDEAERVFGARGPMRLVTSWDVIEHLPDPSAHLATLHRLVEPSGLLSVVTPDRGSLIARLLGPRWVEYQKPEEHIYFFRRTDLRALLARAGFDVVAESTAGKVVPVGFALRRLGAYSPIFVELAEWIGALGERAAYIDPLDKMHLIARRK